MLRLGKHPATPDDRDITLGLVLDPANLPPTPKRFGYGLPTSWGMLGNGPDETVSPGFAGAGDCVFAGAAHETELWGSTAGRPVAFDGASVISDYSACTGYVLGDESTDLGTDVRTAMAYRRDTGILDAAGQRHKIAAYVALPLDYEKLLQAAFVFEVVGLGIQFPDSAMGQFDRRERWDVVPGATIEGGHYVVLTGRRSENDNGVVTWGRRQSATRAFIETYADEAWAAVTEEELRNGRSRRGLDLTGLDQALANLA